MPSVGCCMKWRSVSAICMQFKKKKIKNVDYVPAASCTLLNIAKLQGNLRKCVILVELIQF
jgi:hypothetical protein